MKKTCPAASQLVLQGRRVKIIDFGDREGFEKTFLLPRGELGTLIG